MEKLRSLRKQRGYTQEYMSNILSTDVSNYCRKESGDVRIFDDEWEKLAKALEVPVEDIKEEKPSSIIQNNDNLTFNDSSGNYNYYCSIPNHVLDHLNDYINLLKEQNESQKKDLEKFKSGK